MQLLLIRHGLPLRMENPDGSPADPSLSDAGREQALAVAAWLRDEPIGAVYASPLRRARETAEPLGDALGLPVRIEPGVVEIDAQSSHYIPLEEIKAADPEQWRALVQGGLYAGVDMPTFRRGVTDTVERIIGSHAGESVAIVCHGGVINSWAATVLGIEAHFFFSPEYTSVSRFLAASSGERSVLTLNEQAHLR